MIKNLKYLQIFNSYPFETERNTHIAKQHNQLKWKTLWQIRLQ